MLKEIRRNLVIIIILAVVIGGYAFFFLSPRIFRESKEKLLNTEIGREVKAGSGFSVVVEDWQYCKAEQSMAVIFCFKNSNSNPSEKIEYAAVSRNGARETKAVRCKVIYQSPTMATLTLDAVPTDFNEMAIRVKFVNKHATEDATTALTPKLSESEFKEVTATVFTNVFTVTEADSIKELNVIDLYRQKIERENKALADEIKKLQGEKAGYEVTQSDILARVAELRKDEQFLTDKELEENQRQIKSFRDSYDRYTAQIERNNEEIRDKQSIIRKNNAKIKELDSIRSSSEVAK
ncbi:MAG: hypothetical protein II709_06185 [Ruminococcus sp.]|nr:hypothetical protein [Ruminococcus sp.]